MSVLITGGAGYIGSHTALEFLSTHKNVYVLDNLTNSSIESIKRVEKITGKNVNFINGDIRDRDLLDMLFKNNKFDCVVHFAGLKAVGDSVKKPLEYYNNNVYGTICLLEAMQKYSVKKFIFSSSATVYGIDAPVPYVETTPTSEPTNPYGKTKLFVENILKDLYVSDNSWSIALLRYFNPIGAHKSGLIGEDPKGIPNNLMPYISQVAIGKLPELSIFGNDYPTHDGTGVRDYIHVVDLSVGHLKAYEYIKDKAGLFIWNLGTGRGVSVLEMVNKFKSVTGLDVKYKYKPRRQGDIAAFWSDCKKAERELGWKAENSLEDMIADTWRWQKNNPDGYKD